MSRTRRPCGRSRCPNPCATAPPPDRRRRCVESVYRQPVALDPGAHQGVPLLRGPRRGRTRTRESRGVRRLRGRAAQAAHGARSGGARQVRRRTGPKSSKGWGHDPVVELPQASVDKGGQALEGEGEAMAMDVVREAQTVPEEAVRRLARRGSASPDGDEETCWREASSGTISFHSADGTRLKTLSFGPETGKTMALLAADGRFSGSSGPTSRQSTSFMPANISAKLPIMRSRPAGTTSIASRRRRRRQGYPSDTPFLSARFFRRCRHRMRYVSLKAKDYTIDSGVVEAADKVLVSQRMKRAGMRWSVDGGRNVLTLQGVDDVGPFRRRVAGDDRNGRRERQSGAERRRSLTVEIPHLRTKPGCQTRNRIFTKIALHPSAGSGPPAPGGPSRRPVPPGRG